LASEKDPEDNVFIDLMDFSSITPDPDIGAVLCGLDMHFNYKKIAKAFKYLRENDGCLFVATNLDSTFPTHGSIYPGALSPSSMVRVRGELTVVLHRWWSDDCAVDVLSWEGADRSWEAGEGDAG
jgi:ribonucleotide monophosphatase NagD (HAD superfamily)